MNNLELANSVLSDVKNHKHRNAAKSIQSLLDSDADLKENWGGITRLAITIGEFKKAIHCSQKYLALGPEEPKRIIQSAAILAECRQVNAAIDLVMPLLHDNVTPDVLHFLGTTQSQIGNLELASQYLIKLLNIAPISAISWLTLSAIHKFNRNDDLYRKISSLKHKFDKTSPQSAPYWFALGKAELDLNNSEKAFSFFAHGCSIMHNDRAYSEKQHGDFISEIMNNQTDGYINKLPATEDTQQSQPIFIAGLPRSGTTLLQQILSSHSKIGAGGELKYLSYSTTEIGQSSLNTMSKTSKSEQLSILNKIQKDYFHLQAQQFESGLPIIDKTLNINHHLGIISKTFPHSAIIRIVRNQEDNAWSCFRNFFNQGIDWSYNLKNIASFFHHEERLANHWKNLLGDRVLEITYEELVNSPEKTLKLCLNHIGLEYEEDILSFYKINSLVQTASVGQIRQPLNSNSINSNLKIKKYLQPFSDHIRELRLQ